MLVPSPQARPSAGGLPSNPVFQEDVLLRALRFLDTMLQREAGQKSAFIKDLSQMWMQFDNRLIKHKLLPPLIQVG